MAGVAATCEECAGRRFDASVLEHRLGGKDISEVLANILVAHMAGKGIRAVFADEAVRVVFGR